ncbi:MAG: hypothetical protein GY729_09260, partial [Desulfobacteraceae bacterium]|nr:hypothetical protein [Desulfobacteraceae bacterium]
MNIIQKTLCIVLFLLFCSFSIVWSQEQNLAKILFQAETNKQRIPVLSSQYPQMDIPMAYRVQKAFVEKKLSQDSLAGFKAGLTSHKSQQRFGITDPAAGALFASGKLVNNATINSSRFHQLMLETEIGFIMDQTITQPLKDLSALQKAVKAVVPVIELPDLGYAQAALSSYRVFRQMKERGDIPKHVRFMVGLPSPLS